MPTAAMVEYDQATPDVRAIYDEIMAVKSIDFVPNFWKTLASHPPLLARVWRGLDEAMKELAFAAVDDDAGHRSVVVGNQALGDDVRHVLNA